MAPGTNRPPGTCEQLVQLSCQQEPAGRRVEIDHHLDGTKQPGRELNRVDHHQPVVIDEAGRVVEIDDEG